MRATYRLRAHKQATQRMSAKASTPSGRWITDEAAVRGAEAHTPCPSSAATAARRDTSAGVSSTGAMERCWWAFEVQSHAQSVGRAQRRVARRESIGAVSQRGPWNGVSSQKASMTHAQGGHSQSQLGSEVLYREARTTRERPRVMFNPSRTTVPLPTYITRRAFCPSSTACPGFSARIVMSLLM